MTSVANKEMLSAILRSDLSSFIAKSFTTLHPATEYIPFWYIDHIAYELRECMRGNRRRMIICLPPRYGKSLITSVIFPAWYLGHHPAVRILCLSYGQELAFKMSGDFRRIVESDWYRELFPNFQINPAKCSEREVETLAGGGRLACSLHGAVTGFGGDILILDDILKADDLHSETARENTIRTLKTTVFSRLNNKATGSIILIGQRLHLQDPIAHFIDSEGWHPVILPAICEETRTYKLACPTGEVDYTRPVGEVLDQVREPRKVLDELKATMGAANFNAQYQQRPEYQEDAYIHWEWFKSFDKPPEFDFVFLSVDPAIATNSTADWSVCMVFGVLGEKSYILDVERKRLGFELLATRLDQIATRYRADAIFIERSGIGTSLADYLGRQNRHPIEGVFPKTGKEERVLNVLPQIETGKVWVPATAPWLAVLRSELQAFPNGLFDDQVDCLSQFLNYREPLIRRAMRDRRHRSSQPLRHEYATVDARITTFSGPIRSKCPDWAKGAWLGNI